MKKLAVLIPDFFWSSIPYDGLSLFLHLRKTFPVDLLMFGTDIRLNKVFRKRDRYYFDVNKFRIPELIQLRTWEDFIDITKNYSLVISSLHLTPKGRLPDLGLAEGQYFPSLLHCKLMAVDIGGSDLLLARHRFHYFCVKGPIWKQWMALLGVPEENIFVTGSPHYDPYQYADKMDPKKGRPLDSGSFSSKYNIKYPYILVTPCNPKSHKEQFQNNLRELKEVCKIAKQRNYEVLLKTYPNDYVFYESADYPFFGNTGEYTGIYRRLYVDEMPQYEYIKKYFPKVKLVDSQDHFSALLYADKLFNMSGSHIAWETYFTKCYSYSINYENQPYYSGAPYLAPFIKLPDKEVNINVKKAAEIFDPNLTCSKNCEDYFSKEFSLENIKKVVEKLL